MAERRGTANGEDSYVAWSRSGDESEVLGPKFGGAFALYAAGGMFGGALLGLAHEMNDNSFDGVTEVASGAVLGTVLGVCVKTLMYLAYMSGSRERARSMHTGSPK